MYVRQCNANALLIIQTNEKKRRRKYSTFCLQDLAIFCAGGTFVLLHTILFVEAKKHQALQHRSSCSESTSFPTN